MHRFYLPPNDWAAAALTGPEAHHASHVLRLGPGDRAVLFDGRGREATAEIVSVDSAAVQLRFLQETRTAPLRCRITLAQAIPKGKNMDLIVQKAVEIGAAEIFPLLSARTVVQLDDESRAQKQAKWQTVAIEAAKQCGQNWLPQVHVPLTPNDFFSLPAGPRSPAPNPSPASLDYDLRLIGSLQPGARHLKEILRDYEHEQEREKERRPASVLMLVGPEGDFTPAEIALARSHGCAPLSLGPIILRVETAAIYCLSILSYELL
jgi:16S rRNA (uracil1498-N3)-methyltransferase